MSNGIRRLKRVRKVGPLVSIVAAGAGGQQIVFIRSTGRTFKIKRVMAFNGQPADIFLEIGSWEPLPAPGVWARVLPRMRIIAGFPMNLGELDLPEHEFTTTQAAARASAAGAAPADVECKVEVDEIG